MSVAERRLTDKQTAILKALKRRPKSTRETAEILQGKAHPFVSYASVHSSLRRLEDRELVRRIQLPTSRRKNSPLGMYWELTSKGRYALGG